MKTWVRKSLNVGVLSAGFLLISGGAAHADWTTGYNAGLLNGNQFDTTLQVPVNVCGNSIAVLGFADASCGGGAAAVHTESASATESATTEDWTTGYNAGALNGNQFDTTVQAPVNVSGNAVSLLGFSSASSQGGAYAIKGGAASGDDQDHGRRHHRHGDDGKGNGNGNGNGNGAYAAGTNGDYGTESAANRTEDWTSGFNAGALNGNQFDTTLQAPVNVSGNAIALLGFAGASSQGGAWAVKGESASTESATTEDFTTGYNAGLLNGNQLQSVVQLPINVCGNSIAILGFASANCGGGATAINGGGSGSGSDAGNGGHHGHGHDGWGNDGDGDGSGNGNGGYGDDDDAGANGNGGYGDAGANGNGGYGDAGAQGNGYGPDGNANSNAYANANGNASDAGMNAASAGHAKAHNAKKVHKTHKAHKSIELGEHGKKPHGNGAGMGTANDNGYGNGGAQGDNGYGNGGAQGDNGYDGSGAGMGNGDDDNDGRGHHHKGGNGMGNGGGGATAIHGGCSDWTTGYNAGLLNGNQLSTVLQVPVNVSGNSVALLGFSQAQSSGGALAYSC